jgi:hypothetical protein
MNNNILKKLGAPISLVRALSWKRKATIGAAFLLVALFGWGFGENAWAYGRGCWRAQADWNAGKPCVMGFGLMRMSRDANGKPVPPVDKATGLPIRSLGCMVTNSDISFCRGYNAWTRWLVPTKAPSPTP